MKMYISVDSFKKRSKITYECFNPDFNLGILAFPFLTLKDGLTK